MLRLCDKYTFTVDDSHRLSVVHAVIRLDYVPYMKEILLHKLLSGDDVRSATLTLYSNLDV